MEPAVYTTAGTEPTSSQTEADSAVSVSKAATAPGFRLPNRPVLLAAGVIVIFLTAVAIWMGVPSTRPLAGRPQSAASLPPPSDSLRLRGVTEAVQSRTIMVPIIAGEQPTDLTLIRLAAGGSHVHRGDILAEFDRQVQARAFLDKQAEYQKIADQVVEEQAKETTSRAKDETELQTAEDSLRTAELEMQKVELLSRIGAEKAQETLEEAKATVQQLHQTFDLKRKAAMAGIRILEIQRDRAQQTMMHLQANADLMQIHSPLDGVVVLNTIWKEGQIGQVQEGDQVRPGVPFMQVVDPSVMQVQALANQEDFFALQVGQAATIHLDAYPDLSLPGRLEEIAPVARSGDFSNRLRNFAVLFSIKGTDTRLMPDLSAAVDIDLRGQTPAPGGSR